MIDIKYFASNFPTLPRDFLLQLDDNMRKLAKTIGLHVELVDASSGNQTFQLPDGTDFLLNYQIVKVDSTANTVTVLPYGSQTILGATSFVLSAQYDSAHFTFSKVTNDWVLL